MLSNHWISHVEICVGHSDHGKALSKVKVDGSP